MLKYEDPTTPKKSEIFEYWKGRIFDLVFFNCADRLSFSLSDLSNIWSTKINSYWIASDETY
jgi:hypothetical protein